MHRAKGTEFTKALLFGLSQDSIPMGLDAYDYDEEERSEATLRERSLLYVAASRARDELVATYSGQRSPLLA
ncbi:3'-5' exonuclease [Tessaracoccus oleiagri]|uniref:3'-5' exonuclease n=1 Tax=Tessaracoccus oleiagri TaxID=686624 RepID=UPI001FE055A7|nr:3'-5' exonuclease [Tessaracoccus oleiagri]